MARENWIESSNGLHHIITRGNNRQSILEAEAAKDAFEHVCGKHVSGLVGDDS